MRAHGAERAMQREYAGLLVEWSRAGLHLQRAVVSVEGLHGLLGFGFTAGLLAAYLAHGGEAHGALLLTYWALRIPALGQELMLLARQYAGQRNTTWRLLEPLGAPEEGAREPLRVPGSPPLPRRAAGQGSPLRWRVSVRAGGHTILTDLNLTLAPGVMWRLSGLPGLASRVWWGCSWAGTARRAGACWSRDTPR